MKRGDVVLVRFPHPSGLRGKKRPGVIVQSDRYQGSVRTVVVAEVTSNLAMANDPACVFIDLKTVDGRETGLSKDSVATMLMLTTVYVDRVEHVLGSLSASLLARMEDCIKAALDVN